MYLFHVNENKLTVIKFEETKYILFQITLNAKIYEFVHSYNHGYYYHKSGENNWKEDTWFKEIIKF